MELEEKVRMLEDEKQKLEERYDEIKDKVALILVMCSFISLN